MKSASRDRIGQPGCCLVRTDAGDLKPAEASARVLLVEEADGLLLGVVSRTDLVARLPTRTMTAMFEPQEFPR
jgi:hypothetical protein